MVRASSKGGVNQNPLPSLLALFLLQRSALSVSVFGQRHRLLQQRIKTKLQRATKLCTSFHSCVVRIAYVPSAQTASTDSWRFMYDVCAKTMWHTIGR